MSRPRAKKQRKQLGRNGTAVLVAFALVCVAAAGYYLLIRPKHAEAAALEAKAAEIEAQIAAHPKPGSIAPPPKVVVADLFRMAKAMPDGADVAGLLLELNRVAKEAGIVFESLSPSPVSPRGAYSVVGVNVALRGDFYTLSDFLFRLRNLVQLRDGALTATGRLFTVDSISFTPDESGRLSASLALSAFVYGAAPPPGAAPAAPPAETGTTSTETTSTETTGAGETTPPPADPSQPAADPATAAPAAGGTS